MKTTVLLTLSILGSAAHGLTLEQYLGQVEKKNKNLQAYEALQSAAEDRQISGDLELNPILNMGVANLQDKSPLGQGASIGARGGIESTTYSLGLAKKFSTGTGVKLSADASEFEIKGATGLPPKLALGSLTFEMSQSLWKNAFGRGTRLRQTRESESAMAEKRGYELQKRVALSQAEAAFWDFLYAEQELKLRDASLARAKRIETWIRRRVSDGISDRADLLSAEALVASRELQLLTAQDERIAAEKKIRDTLELSSDEPTPQFVADINKKRALTDLVGGKGRVVALDYYITNLVARARQAGAKEAEDALRSDLVLAGRYKTNALEDDLTAATNNWTKTNLPTQSVALNWVYMFDTDVKKAAVSSARKEALAAQLQAERKSMESDTQWSEINRRYMELSKKIESASTISSLQTNRARAEADKFNKGRSVTSNVINSEEDAAEAELFLTKLKVEQRKLEAQSRLFIAVE